MFHSMLTRWIDVIEDKGGNDVPIASKHSILTQWIDIVEDKGGNDVNSV